MTQVKHTHTHTHTHIAECCALLPVLESTSNAWKMFYHYNNYRCASRVCFSVILMNSTGVTPTCSYKVTHLHSSHTNTHSHSSFTRTVAADLQLHSSLKVQYVRILDSRIKKWTLLSLRLLPRPRGPQHLNTNTSSAPSSQSTPLTVSLQRAAVSSCSVYSLPCICLLFNMWPVLTYCTF